jgi:hypothetical protein
MLHWVEGEPPSEITPWCADIYTYVSTCIGVRNYVIWVTMSSAKRCGVTDGKRESGQSVLLSCTPIECWTNW